MPSPCRKPCIRLFGELEEMHYQSVLLSHSLSWVMEHPHEIEAERLADELLPSVQIARRIRERLETAFRCEDFVDCREGFVPEPEQPEKAEGHQRVTLVNK